MFKELIPQRIGNCYVWKELGLRKIPNKNNELGVIALVDLPEGTRLRYHGIELDKKETERLKRLNAEDPKGRWHSYVYNIEKQRIDGHPRHSPDSNGVGGKGLFLAAMVNEPAPGEMVNCQFWNIDGKPVLETSRPIKAGTELLVFYGKKYDRDYSIGFTRYVNPNRYPLRSRMSTKN